MAPRNDKKGLNKLNKADDLIFDDADEIEKDEDEVDPEVKDLFDEAQELNYGSNDLSAKLNAYTSRSPKLTGGDIDASWEYADIGEEAAGGENPTPDQSVVEEEGEALGVTFEDNEPLHDKLEERDEKEPWELHPASTPDYSQRVNEEFHKPLNKLMADAGLETTTSKGTARAQRVNKTASLRNRQVKHAAAGTSTRKASKRKPTGKNTRRQAASKNSRAKSRRA